MKSHKKTGRPKIDNKKDTVIRCRVTKEFNEKLEDYCEKSGKTKTAVIVEGVETVIKRK